MAYTDAEKTFYINQALQKGIAMADINAFLAHDPNDYGRLLTALAPNPGSSATPPPALLAPTAPPSSVPPGGLGAPSTPSDGYLAAHLNVEPFGTAAAPNVTVNAPAAAAAALPSWIWLAAGAFVVLLLVERR